MKRGARKWKMWAVVRKYRPTVWTPHLFWYRNDAKTIAAKHPDTIDVIRVEVRELPRRRAAK